MNTFELATIETAADNARPLLEGAKKQLGFVPNLFAGLANSPAALAAYFDLAKHLGEIGLTGLEQQIILLATSFENDCAYCMSAHSTISTGMKIDPTVLAALRRGGELPDAKLNALATFVRQLIRTKGHVSETEVHAFIAAGYTREQSIGVIIGISLKTLTNIANHLMKTPIDEQFAAHRWEK